MLTNIYNLLNSKFLVCLHGKLLKLLKLLLKLLKLLLKLLKLFPIPNWIPKLCRPQIQFDLDPPTYQQITTVIRKMKTSESPCPLDQLSIICFKRCPYLRTYLTELIRSVWLSGTIPVEWKGACTILIHKRSRRSI